ncbi:transcriptional regulator [Halobacteriales archaeon QS_3_64_16]|nr:MAG: transcriptional regulator [Halobacteriales archaeon QS_3_64_16]
MTDDESTESTSSEDESATPETVLEAMRDLDGTAYTGEIADHVGCEDRTAERALGTLEEEDAMTHRETEEGTLWILPEVGDI